ncbi:MAG: adenylate/guanylate cyclase domain-containing protein [Acidimicrobiia bacterium]
MDLAEYQAAGLYDPDAPDAAVRLELLRHLEARGATLNQMIKANAAGSLHAASTDTQLRPGRVVSAQWLADEVGIPVDLLRRITLAAGVMLPDDDYRDSDLEIFTLFAGSAGMFGEEATLQFTRAVGSSMARVADAALSLFLVNVEGPLLEGGGGEISLAEASEDAVESLVVIPALMGRIFRLHMQAAINRQRVANNSAKDPGVFHLAVGFVDLVGFTPYTEDVGHRELAGFVESFEARANDVVAARGGRVVKHIGDEVMFVDADPASACDIALQLVDTFGGEAGVSPHAGIGFGPLVARGGDYYGSVVNLASRIADLAVPGEVLVTEAVERVARGVDPELAFEAAGKRLLKGFADPIPLWSVTRSRPAP